MTPYIINRADWTLLQWAKAAQAGDLAPMPFEDADDGGVPVLLEEDE